MENFNLSLEVLLENCRDIFPCIDTHIHIIETHFRFSSKFFNKTRENDIAFAL